ncbi:23S rRNA (adenine(2030)-N(6))-methyltransferase RlmJ [Ferrovibrio sp.]|uniref:23S rRNA (adenine(2030)-N(6))-methyltransferase RlmJ n=1 Tax=Ferrovibrio sp. TaxID=1917215 RepID=UPI0035AE3115
MNYRHSFHAGNHGDVLKHVVLLEMLDALRAKPSPFHLLDSHAGRGLYDLAGDEAQRGGEYRLGVGALLADPAAATALPLYWAALRDLNPDLSTGGGGLRHYPGSPWLLRRALRETDRLSLVELHPEEHAALKRNLGRDTRISIHRRDAWEALGALLPPNPRRGLVLIDPAFEQRDEFNRAGDALLHGLQRWPTGQYVLWYPIKQRASTDAFIRDIAKRNNAPMLRVELLLRKADSDTRLNGSGLLIVNPPWKLAERLAGPLDFIAAKLAREAGGGLRLDWPNPEKD